MKFNSQKVGPWFQQWSAIDVRTMFDGELAHGSCVHNSGKIKSVTVVHILPAAQ